MVSSALSQDRILDTHDSDLTTRFNQVRAQTEELCATLNPEDQMVQSMADASPTKWHLAHTTWFYETFILEPNVAGYRAFDPRFRVLFNSYYNAVGDKPLRSVRGAFSRPTLDEVHGYRRHVNEAMNRLLAANGDSAVRSLAVLGLNHEQQHQELIITDIKHALWTNPIRPAYRPSPPPAEPHRAAPQTLAWFAWEDGLYPIGADSGEDFTFDNEGPRHQVYVQEFSLGSRPITNREYLNFIEDGGYRRPELWLSDGWETVQTNRWSAPLYWEQDQDGWRLMTSGGMHPLQLDGPVCHVSFYEADAYARWAGARLPTEAEWEVAATDAKVEGNLLESGNFHPVPARGSDGRAPQQLFGDVWEWTASPYSAYPGYQPVKGALGEYNSKFMCNQMVLRGGSCATPRSHIRAAYRNFFPPQVRWQFSGIRLARDGK